jgi:hypothetical protein
VTGITPPPSFPPVLPGGPGIKALLRFAPPISLNCVWDWDEQLIAVNSDLGIAERFRSKTYRLRSISKYSVILARLAVDANQHTTSCGRYYILWSHYRAENDPTRFCEAVTKDFKVECRRKSDRSHRESGPFAGRSTASHQNPALARHGFFSPRITPKACSTSIRPPGPHSRPRMATQSDIILPTKSCPAH